MRSYLLTLNVFLIFIVSSCKKGTPIISLPIDSSKYVSISSVSDSTAMLGKVITIYGKNFSKDSIKSVEIGGIQSSIYEINTDSIKLAFKDTVNGTISINTGNRTLATTKNFRTLSADISTISTSTYPASSLCIDVNDNLHYLLYVNGQFGESICINYINGTAYTNNPFLGWRIDNFTFRNWITQNSIITIGKLSYVLLYTYGFSRSSFFSISATSSSDASSRIGPYFPFTDQSTGLTTSPIYIKMAKNSGVYGLNDNGLFKYDFSTEKSSNILSATALKSFTNSEKIYLRSIDEDSLGNMYISGQKEIWKIDESGKISLFLGTPSNLTIPQLTNIGYVVADPEGNLFVSNADATTKDYSIWYINKYKDYVKIAGGTNTLNITRTTSPDGDAKTAAFSGITGLVRDSKGNLFISQSYGGIKKIAFK